MNKIDQQPSSRRSPYEKFSDAVFSITGLPLKRLLMIIFGLLLLTASIVYALRGDADSSELKTQELERNELFEAVSLPANFSSSPFPVQIDTLDQKIKDCSRLLSQKNDYSVGVQEQLLAPFSLKAMTLSDNGLDPSSALELLQSNFDQISNSSTKKSTHQYLLVGTYMKVLAENPESDSYAQATAVISAIQETTPVPRHRAIFSFHAAMKYFKASKDKVKSGKLVRLLGERMAIAKDQEVSEFGFSLFDFPNFYQCYEGSIKQSKFSSKLEPETIQFLKQIEETPPLTVQTYVVLMNVPEQHLQAGNKEVALNILDQLTSAASSSAPRIRDTVLAKLAKQRTRINLLNSPFPLSGFDATGKTIDPLEKDEILIVFFDPDDKRSKGALQRVAASPVWKRGSTETYLASVSELSADVLSEIKKTFPTFIVADEPTSKQWIEKSGVDNLPYSIRLDGEGVVQLLSVP